MHKEISVKRLFFKLSQSSTLILVKIICESSLSCLNPSFLIFYGCQSALFLYQFYRNMLFQKPQDSALQLRTLQESGSSIIRNNERKITLKGCQKGDFTIALQHITSLTNRYQNGEEVSWNVDVEHFKQYGTGVYLFFHLTKRLAILFAIFALISIIPVVINATNGDAFSNMIKTTGIYFARTTVGNLNSNPGSASTIDSDTSRKYKLENSIPDILICFAFLGFYLYWEVKSDKLTEQIKGQIRLQCHHSLELHDFPVDTTQQLVHQFFSQFGKVKEVSAVQNYSELLEQAKDIYDLSQRRKELLLALEEEGDTAQPQKVKQRQKQAKECEQRIAEMENKFAFSYNEGSVCVLKYFVIFEKSAGRQLALKTLNQYNKCWKCSKASVPEEYLLNKQLVGVSPCHNQPGDIIWQNLHIPWGSRALRGIAQVFLLIMVLATTFLVISLLNIATPSTSTYLDVSHYDRNTIMNVTNSTILYVWCIDNKDLMNTYPSIKQLCNSYINRYYASYVIGIFISCIVVGVKFVLKKIVVALAKFQRYHGHTEQSIGIMRNLFYTYVCTTTLITILLQANIFGLSFKQAILTLTSNAYLTQNGSMLLSFGDFVPFWYVDIGYKMNLTLIIMALTPLMTPVILLIKQKFKQWHAKKQVTQRRMEEVMMPDNFQIEDHYANTLLIIFMACAFSSGMPLILIPCAIALVLRYFYYKLVFLRFNLTPPSLDEALNENVVKTLPFILFFHFAFGIWMFSTSSIFPNESSFLSSWLDNKSSFVQNCGFILRRIGNTWYFTISFLICIAVVILKIIFYDVIYQAYKARTEQREPTMRKIQIEPAAGTRPEQEMIMLNSYKIESNPKYSEILAIMNKLRSRTR